MRRRRALLACLPACLLLTQCGVAVRQAAHGYREVRYSSIFEKGRRGPLGPAEMEWAKTAWKYFQNNVGGTGVASTLDKSPVTSMWSAGDYLAALNAARELGLIKDAEFSDRVTRAVQFLNNMELYDRRLPNLHYNVHSGAMVNASNSPAAEGWSALDLGRLLIWLRISAQRMPVHSEYIDKAVLRWNFCDIVDGKGSLYAGRKKGEETELVQRLGYEEYAALGFQAWGFDTHQASRLEPFGKARIAGVEVLYDSRDPRQSKTLAPLVTLPHALIGMEFNWDPVNGGAASQRALAVLAQRVHDVQEARFRKERILTARSDHPLARPPNYVYDTIFLSGYPWNTLTLDGTFAPQEALVSTRAAFGLWALWKTGYTQTLMESTRMVSDPSRGWFEGRFEKTGGLETTLSSTTNAIVLEALLYVKTGKLFRPVSDEDYYSLTLRSEFSGPQTCLPQRR
jgi:hypothetical protein